MQCNFPILVYSLIQSLKHEEEKKEIRHCDLNVCWSWFVYRSPSLVSALFHLHEFPVCSSVTHFWWTKMAKCIHWNFLLFKQLGCNSSATLTGPVFLLSSTFHPPQRFLQGSSPLCQSDLTACPGTPCHRSAQQHTGLSDGPPGRGPSTPLWRRTPSGCPVGRAMEHRYNQSITLKNLRMSTCVSIYVFMCICVCVLVCFQWVETKKEGVT